MHFVVVGLNYKTAVVEVREKLFFQKDELFTALSKLTEYSSVQACVILSTCNRVEVYASVDKINEGIDNIINFLCKFKNINLEHINYSVYKKNCQMAVTHLFKVASGIDSMVVGEYQIQGQVRDAYFFAKDSGFTNNLVNKLFQTAINIGKRVRTETEIGKGSLSVATLAVELIKQVFRGREKFNVLLVGAGDMAETTAVNLQKFKNCKINVTNRSFNKALDVAAKVNGTATEFSQRYEAVNNADVIIVSTSADKYTINLDEVKILVDKHPNRVKIFIDISIPRNVNPDIANLENCLVYCIDDINNMINLNMNKRSLEVEKAEEIIESVSQDYYDWYAKQFIVPTMQKIKSEVSVLKQRTFATFKSELLNIDDKNKELIDKMLDAYSDKLIKVIMKNIKNSTSKEDLIAITETLRQSFTFDVADE